MRKNKVLLISPNTETAPMPVYPLSLARLARAVETRGDQVRQFDLLVHGNHQLPGVLQEYQPNLVALSLRNLDNLDTTAYRSYLSSYREIMNIICSHTQAPVVLGGSGFSLLPHELLQRLDGNLGVIGPGEGALSAILQALDEGASSFPQILNGTEYNDGAFQSRHEPELVEYYWRFGGMIGLQTKRGCPRHCSYCTYPLIDGNRTRYAEIPALVEEIELLVRKMGVTYFYFVDSVFNQDREHELAFAEEILRRDLAIRWCAFFAPSGLDREYLKVLKKSGLTHVEFGTEAMCDRMLSSYKKGFNTAEVVHNSSLANELGLHVCHYLLFGGPGEAPDTVRETLTHARKLSDCVFFPFVGVRIYPGTDVYLQALNENQVQVDSDYFAPIFYNPEGFAREAIWEMLRRETEGLTNWLFPSKYEDISRILKRLRQRGLKGPLWEYLLQN
ncbi:MAG: radical SAM protein [Desulfobacterales bacterium]|nr:radical SAM protein [Pseudomonadota bacterium]MBU4354274.1 radical SAM protein [Pseudomonadota bacterium]MCG2771578.1 radical SAM protein [Desulfobacterales bacterium]